MADTEARDDPAERRTETEAAPLDLPALERLDKEATPGPWESDCETAHSGDGGYRAYYLMDANGDRIADSLNADVTEIIHDDPESFAYDLRSGRNMRLIAAVRNQLPALIERARVAETLAGMIAELHERIHSDCPDGPLSLAYQRLWDALADARSAGLLPSAPGHTDLMISPEAIDEALSKESERG